MGQADAIEGHGDPVQTYVQPLAEVAESHVGVLEEPRSAQRLVPFDVRADRRTRDSGLAQQHLLRDMTLQSERVVPPLVTKHAFVASLCEVVQTVVIVVLDFLHLDRF